MPSIQTPSKRRRRQARIFSDEREWKRETFTIEEIQTATLAASAYQAHIRY